jgi:hypothetical protein
MLDGVFIRNHHHTKQAMKFNDKGQAREPRGQTRNNSGRDTLDIEGVLAVQRLVFLELAAQENGAKGLFLSNSTGSEDLERLMVLKEVFHFSS